MIKILILCTGNSCRSQMAEGWLTSFDDRLQVFSAGTEPAAEVHPLAIRVMAEVGIDLRTHHPKKVDQFLADHFDYVITVCDHARQVCPVFTGSVQRRLHIGFDDPYRVQGSEEFKLQEYRRVRDEIREQFFILYQQQLKTEVDMNKRSWGFMGAGRITRIILEGFRRAGQSASEIVVTDINAEVLSDLHKQYPYITVTNDAALVARQDYVFLALHPPAMTAGLETIKSHVTKQTVVISLAPKFSLEKIATGLADFDRIARWLPNAATFIAKGYNPCAFSSALSSAEQTELTDLFSSVGDCVAVDEKKIEAYAMIIAMGPTYFWFQWQHLCEIGKSFGLSEEELKTGIPAMLKGAIDTLYESGLTPNQAMDLIPVKPLAEEEVSFNAAYDNKLGALYQKLKV
jgi:pyrroline-5-carboxylate reductase